MTTPAEQIQVIMKMHGRDVVSCATSLLAIASSGTYSPGMKNGATDAIIAFGSQLRALNAKKRLSSEKRAKLATLIAFIDKYYAGKGGAT